MAEAFGILALGYAAVIIMVTAVRIYRDEQKRWRQRARQSREQAAAAKRAAARASRSTDPPPSRLSKKVRANFPITSNQITVVTYYMTSRDEFLGAIEILEGHPLPINAPCAKWRYSKPTSI